MTSLHSGEPGTRVVEELGLCQGTARIDIAVVNGSLRGFEIKSERDTLHRLPGQCEAYSQCLDFVTIVASTTHIDKVRSLVPNWWGIWSAHEDGSGVKVEIERPEQRNPDVKPLAMAQLLWRDEALQVLGERNLTDGIRSKTRARIWQRLATSLTTDELGDAVRAKLKAREGWRADAPRV
jgi:hypothetical protein